MGAFAEIGQIVSEVAGSLASVRIPDQFVTNFGYPGASSALINNGYGGAISLGPSDVWTANIESCTSEVPHYWEFGINVADERIPQPGDSGSIPNGLSYVTFKLYVNDVEAASGQHLVETVFIPANSLVRLDVFGAMPDGYYASFTLTGYAVRVMV